MKHILQIGMTSNHGGIESFIMNVYRNMDRDKFQFDFINMETEGKEIAYSDEIKNLGGKIYKIPGRRENFRENRNRLKQILQENYYDYVHNNVLTWSYSDGITLPLKYSSSKVIVHSHNSYMNPDLYARRILNLFNRRFNNIDSLTRLACSNEAGKWLFSNKSFTIIPNGIDTVKYKFDYEIRNKYRKDFDVVDKKVFLNVGRLSHQKNHKFLLDWFKKIHCKDNNTVLFLVGDGELKKELKERVKLLNLTTSVKFLGIRKDVKDLMFMSDALLFPSFYEGLPVVLVEAQATGLPAVISNTISREIDITNGISRINISELPEKYVDLALTSASSSQKNNRNAAYINVKNAGYDIGNTVKMLEEIYSSES